MQNLPVILAVFIAAVAIIAVLFWRIKPQTAANAEILDKRIAEEVKKSETLQAKLEAKEDSLRTAEIDSAAAKATMDAAKIEAIDAKLGSANAESRLSALQVELNQANPLIARATAEKEASEAENTRLVKRHDDLVLERNILQRRLDEALQRAATAQADTDNKRLQIDDLSHTVETLEMELTKERAAHVVAVTKQQSDEASASQFKVISQEVLDKTLEEAKRGMAELSATFQKTSGAELEKHAGQVARTLEPLQVKLEAYDKAIKSMEDASHKSYGGLIQQITELKDAELSLNKQAKALTTALSSSPKVKGSYGELMLKQLVEFVGMHERCHFETQAAHDTEDGRKIPDMVVSLPNGQKVLVDSKAVMDACVEAHQSDDDAQRVVLLKKHCDNVRSRVADLASKNYFAGQRDTVEAVVLFLPAENLYATAVENDPGLTEYAMRQNIIVCGPNSLMMLLKVANQLWQRASIEEEALKIKECGDNIYKSACDFIEKFVQIGTKIRQLEGDYNDAAGTLDSRLIPRGREMGRFTAVANHREVKDVTHLKEDIREFRSVEAKKLLASTSKLTGIVIGDKTAELEFSAGDK